jgi:hypothetical protein
MLRPDKKMKSLRQIGLVAFCGAEDSALTMVCLSRHRD